MKVSFIGADFPTLNLAKILKEHNADITGVYDISLQKSVEFAMKTDTKVLISVSELLDVSDIIMISDHTDSRNYIRELSDNKASDKLICLISDKSTSDKIYTNETNTHFSLYCPHLYVNLPKVIPDIEIIFEGYGTRRTEMKEYLSDLSLKCYEITIEQAKELYACLNLFTNGIETLKHIMSSALTEMDITDDYFVRAVLTKIADSTNDSGAFYTNDTYHIIKTLDTLKTSGSTSRTSLYKILALNALEHTSYTKNERDHIMEIILDNQNK